MTEMIPLKAAEWLEHLENMASWTEIASRPEYAPVFHYTASILRQIAAGEYKQVVHGRWVIRPFNATNDKYGMNKYNMRIECTNCGFVTSSELKYAICPVCGALMDRND